MSLKWLGMMFDRCPHGEYKDRICKDCVIIELKALLASDCLAEPRLLREDNTRLQVELSAMKDDLTIAEHDTIKLRFIAKALSDESIDLQEGQPGWSLEFHKVMMLRKELCDAEFELERMDALQNRICEQTEKLRQAQLELANIAGYREMWQRAEEAAALQAAAERREMIDE